jgi:hypothetical protein
MAYSLRCASTAQRPPRSDHWIDRRALGAGDRARGNYDGRGERSPYPNYLETE